MKTGKCTCSNRIYFNNDECLKCHKPLGRCEKCFNLTSFTQLESDQFVCDFNGCGETVKRCSNWKQCGCQVMTTLDSSGLCQLCEMTRIIPDLNVPENIIHWQKLERAKRRLLIQLHDLNFPPFAANVGNSYPLVFEFKQDEIDPSGNVLKVMTGHQEGVIVINTAEADSVHREQTRVNLQEPQRTLIGHLRHEIGHYLDWCLVQRVAAEDYKNLFGDPQLDYEEALKKYYAEPVPADWAINFVSRYATMHPMEDFAETVNVYLDLMAIATTANDQGITHLNISPEENIKYQIDELLQISIMVSELNHDMGLPTLLPERISPVAVDKLNFVHQLRSKKTIRKLQQLDSREPVSAGMFDRMHEFSSLLFGQSK